MSKSRSKSTANPSNGQPLPPELVDLRPEHFINRELSWLEFNNRVLEEAQDPSTPLLERVKFLSIFSSNLDEFFMVRVAGLRQQAFEDGAPQDLNVDGLRAIDQLKQIRRRTRDLTRQQYRCLNEHVLPQLAEHGIRIVKYADVDQRASLEDYFQKTVFPIITPMAIDPSHPRPRYHNRAIYLGGRLRRRRGLGPKRLFCVVQLPLVIPRLIKVGPDPADHTYVLLEDLIEAHLPALFGGFDVEETSVFRITRDSDIDLIEQESDDMLRLIEERLKARSRADAVRLEVSAGSADSLIDLIISHEEIRTLRTDEELGYTELYHIDGPLDLTALNALLKLPNLEDLREPPLVPKMPRGLRRHGEDLLEAIARRDVLLHHPYESFQPVIDFVRTAAEDPHVLAIKQTLYRTSGDSPVVQALIEAAENGKHVTAIVELKARFDEAANVSWARQLERSGVHVVYGFMDLKTHCKVSLVVRQEGEEVRRYVHLSTGNYNPTTAQIYTDIGLFTADADMTSDVSALFNLLTGYSQGHEYQKLSVAPQDLQRATLELIEEQTSRATKNRPSRIFAKLNSLVDPQVIEALYRASQAGVPVDLIVRGICCLRPGIKGISENIRVRSIVDRFLEHSRIFVFGPDEKAKIFLSSADWMPRNFYRRVEVMFPVEAAPLRKRVLHEIMPAYFADNVKARELRSDGTYVRIRPKSGKPPYRCQERLQSLSEPPVTETEPEKKTKSPKRASRSKSRV
ncbi:MAG: polyphosphate kinase 1 [Planctomycetota bacterium]